MPLVTAKKFRKKQMTSHSVHLIGIRIKCYSHLKTPSGVQVQAKNKESGVFSSFQYLVVERKEIWEISTYSIEALAELK